MWTRCSRCSTICTTGGLLSMYRRPCGVTRPSTGGIARPTRSRALPSSHPLDEQQGRPHAWPRTDAAACTPHIRWPPCPPWSVSWALTAARPRQHTTRPRTNSSAGPGRMLTSFSRLSHVDPGQGAHMLANQAFSATMNEGKDQQRSHAGTSTYQRPTRSQKAALKMAGSTVGRGPWTIF